jgi:hypothetical protein
MALGLAGSGIITGFDSASDGFGRVLQVIRATDTTERTTTSTSFVDVTGMSVTITPQKSDSALIIICSALFDTTAANRPVLYQLTDASDNPISGAEDALVRGDDSRQDFVMQLIGYVTPATISAVTYKLRFSSSTGNSVRVRNNVNTGQMFAIEVSA